MIPYRRLSAYYFFYFAFVGVFSPYFTLYLQSLEVPATDIALLMSLPQLMRLLAPNLWGWLAERFGVRLPVVRVSALLSLGGFSLFFLTREFQGLLAAMLLMSLFWSAALPLVESTTFAHLGAQRHRYGSIRAWGSVGFVVLALALGHGLDFLPIRAVLWAAALMLAGVFCCALLVPEAPLAPRHHETASLRETLRRPEVQALFGACFCMAAAHGPLYVFYSIHLVGQGYDKALVGWMWTLGVLAEIVVFMFMPRLNARFPLRTVLLAAFVCAVLRFLLIGWGPAFVGLLILAQLLHGASFGAYHAAAIEAVSHWFPGRLQAHGQALYGSLSFGAGGMLGGLASGHAWEVLGPAWTYSLGAGFALIGLLWLARGWRPANDAGMRTR